MVLVTSTFRVANGMETAVRQAFLDRPRMVDDVSGFRGMEALVDHADGSILAYTSCPRPSGAARPH